MCQIRTYITSQQKPEDTYRPVKIASVYMPTVKHMNKKNNMPNVYNFKIGEYDLAVTVTHENVRLSFNKSSDKGISEFPFLGGE